MKVTIALLTAAAITAASIIPNTAQAEDAPVTFFSVPNALAEEINKMSLDLYAQLNEDGKNTFFSPLSISTAFGLAQQGAAGETADEMREALRISFTKDSDVIATGYEFLMKSLNDRESEDAFKLHIANALWVQEGYGINDAYTKTAKDSFDARAEELPFQANPDESAAIINKWVAEKTADKIKNLIPASAITNLTRLILTNAVYFKGTWQSKFKKHATHDKEFHLLDGNSPKVPTMHQTSRFGYHETDTMQALEMRYKKCGLSMVVLLPKAKDGLSALEKELDEKLLAAVTAKLKQSRRVRVALPKWTVKTKYGLNAPMQALGMKKAFTAGQADFSGITEKEQLFIQAALHKAYINVDEEGTEAAAATGLMISATSVELDPPTPFIADHPFMFMIRDTKTGVILFMGRVLDPR